MTKAEAKIGFLKEYREHPEKYLPLIDHAWKCFADKDTGENPWDDPEYNIGWNAGVIGDNRPFFLECWATCGITMLTYFVSTIGIEEYGTDELLEMLEKARLVRGLDPEHPRTTAVKVNDNSGNEFFSVNIVCGDEEGTYAAGGEIYSYRILNAFNGEGKDT